MKYLILGINGMAGHMIARYLLNKGHQVVGFAREKNSFCETMLGNAMNISLINNLIETNKFDVIVNCIGVLNQAVDNDLASGIYLNSYLPHCVADCCKKKGVKFIHISTDCIFSGRTGNYTENSVVDETSYYGKTKFLGEVKNNNHLTLRTSIIGPEIKTNGVGLFHWFMKEKKTIYGFSNVLWSGVTTLELAKVIESAVCEDLSGLYQLSNNAKISKYDLLKLFNQYFCDGTREIVKKTEIVNDKSLICTRQDFAYDLPTYEVMIEELSKWMQEHKILYSQYIKRG